MVQISDIEGVTTELELSGSADETVRLQDAIDAFASMPVDSTTGYRGTLRLGAGTWLVSDTITIGVSGVVLAGSTGAAPTIISALESGFETEQKTVLEIHGTSSGSSQLTSIAITDTRVPVGHDQFNVADASSFAVGDEVIMELSYNDAWLAAIGMNNIPDCSESCSSWNAADYVFRFFRVITEIQGNIITVDLPLTAAIDTRYNTAVVYGYTNPGRIDHVGVRDITFVAEYSDGADDETHAWSAVTFDNCRDGFA
eukprot:SAG31_NODE_4923_length_2861_cov_1.583997_1_plen_255_part_10